MLWIFGREEMALDSGREWTGSPLMGRGIEAGGVAEIVIEYDTGSADVFRPKLRDEFGSYELHQMTTYLDTIAGELRKEQKR